jgi:hypothetical protein
MALTVTQLEIAADGSVARKTLLPYLCETKGEAIETARREAARYPKYDENDEQGYFWARDDKGRRFRFIP